MLALIWLAWVISWVVASFWSGRTKAHVPTLSSLAYRIPILLGAILFMPWTGRALGETPLYHVGDLGTYALAVVVVLGISFTWWARIHLGRFWSNAITHKEDHKVVDTGPYGVVRHPIYTGILTGFLGTAIALSQVRGVVVFVLVFLVFWAKLRMEENWMRSQFGESYAIYAHQTAALVPYLF